MAGTRRKPGRLGPHVEGYGAWLLELGYTPPTVRGLLKGFGQLGRWMAEHGVATEELDIGVVNAFIEARRLGGYRRVPTLRSFKALVDYLRSAGAIRVEALRPPAPASPLDELLAEYLPVDDHGARPGCGHGTAL